MSFSAFQSPNWYRAVTLGERLASLRQTGLTLARESIDEESARESLNEWKSASPFDSDLYFAQRLALEDVTEGELLRLLGEPPEAIRARMQESPAWLRLIEQAFADPDLCTDVSTLLPGSRSTSQTVPFLNVIAPLIKDAERRITAAATEVASRFPHRLFDPGSVSSLFVNNLIWPLQAMLSRTMVLELNVARLQGLLEGGTAEERFKNFVERLRDPEVAVSLLSEYPVLARRISIYLGNWSDFVIEFLTHLCTDWDAVRGTIFTEIDPGSLELVTGGVGDVHRRGRSVLIITFSSGQRLVYKPRAMSVDLHFQELLTWINERGDHPPFRRLRLVERGDHGWVEFVTPQPCSSEQEVRFFYQRQGGYLALLYALEATDFHFENLIAAGEHPVLIDLESLFHSRFRSVETEQPDLLLVARTTSNSVMRIGLLPRRTWSNKEYKGIDLSGMGSVAGQQTPDRVLQWERIGTDEMKAVRQRLAMPGGRNRPVIDEAEADPLDYSDDVAEGFAKIYRLLIEHRDELLSTDGPLSRFAADELRTIIRPTRVYGMVLHESFHPDLLRDAMELERFLDKLWVGIEEMPHLRRTIHFERRDLFGCDIPMFTTRAGSRDIWSSGGERIEEFLGESGMELVRRRIQRLNEEDLRRQVWFARASLATLTLESERFRWPRHDLREPEAPFSVEELRRELTAAARLVGDRLCELALRNETDAAWIGFSFSHGQWALTPLEDDLYAGAPGVILALAYLGAITKVDRYTELAKLAFETLRRRLTYTSRNIRMIGGFNGWGSLIYLFTHLGSLWNDGRLFDEAERIVNTLPELIEQDNDLDVIGGAAGCIGSLLALYSCRPSKRILDNAVLCGQRIVFRAKQMPQGVGWFTRIETDRPITGFSHGCSGMAWALSELAKTTGDERFLTTALDAILYENTQFSLSEGNWFDPDEPEKRSQPQKNEEKLALSMAWCYGAPGIGLSRLRCLPVIDHPLVREELNQAVKTTLVKGFGTNHSICHGDLGNLDFLLQASETLNEPDLTARVERLQSAVTESIKRDGFLCGVPLGVESPALMNGLAGICYGLLRQAHPASVPSVLILAPPAENASRS